MKRIISIILAVCFLLSAAAYAEMGVATQMNNEAVFSHAVSLLQFYHQPESIQQAANMFSNLPGSYNQAVYFVTYAQAMLGIQEGLYEDSLTQLDTLKEFSGYGDFETSLQGYGLPSCADLAVYIRARHAEAEERYYDAYELYKQADIMDALTRAIALSEYKTRPTPTPMPTTNPNDFLYVISNSECTITKYKGNETELVIPAEIEGCPVTAIRYHVFKACTTLKSISLPESITSIGDLAFQSCNSLTNIAIPDSVVSVDANPFAFCENLTEIKVSADHPALEIIDGALLSKADKRLISYPAGLKTTAYTIPQGTDSIGHYAFNGCDSITSITIPEGVTSIGISAFHACYSLTSVTIPDSVTSIGEDAFWGCNSLLTIYCKPGSYAEQYAKENNLKCSPI